MACFPIPLQYALAVRLSSQRWWQIRPLSFKWDHYPRARVTRIRNACFTGLRVDDDVRAALDRFDGMLLRGEDVST